MRMVRNKTRWLSSLVAGRRSIRRGLLLGLLAGWTGYVAAQIVQRPLDPATGKSAGVSYFASGSAPTRAADGELAIVSQGVGNASQVQLWNSTGPNADSWVEVPASNALTADFNNNVTLGSSEDDFIDVNAPVRFRVIRVDFETPYRVWDWTNNDGIGSVADDEPNLLIFPEMVILYEHEVAFAGTLTESTFINTGTAADGEGRVWLLDDATILDVVNSDAIDVVFGGTEIDGAEMFIEEATDGLDAYCEISLRIDDISDIDDDDFYFGWFLNTAIDDTFAFAANNTWASFHMEDTAGDLQICAEEDGDTHGCDDSGTTWADDATHVLRVEISADAVAFSIDGTAVSATNAVMDADATEQFVCRMGIRSAGTSNAVLELNYVEIGKEQ